MTWAKLFILTVCNDLYNLCLHTTSFKRFVQLKRRDFSTEFKFVIGILRLQTRNLLFVELFNACLSSGSEVSPQCNRSEDDNDKLWFLVDAKLRFSLILYCYVCVSFGQF